MLFNKKIYLDIAALFDLRQGAMAVVDPGFAVAVTTKPDYYIREVDVFSTAEHGTLSKDLLNELFVKFKKDILANSVTTKIPEFIKQLYAKLLGINAKQSVELGLSLDLNIYPFALTEAEQEILANSLYSKVGELLPVNIISVAPVNLSIEQAGDSYIGMIFYDYGGWINSHEKTFSAGKLSNTTLYVPRLYFNGKPKESDLAEFNSRQIDPFEMWERTLTAFVKINYIPIAFFCVDLPANESEYTTPV